MVTRLPAASRKPGALGQDRVLFATPLHQLSVVLNVEVARKAGIRAQCVDPFLPGGGFQPFADEEHVLDPRPAQREQEALQDRKAGDVLLEQQPEPRRGRLEIDDGKLSERHQNLKGVSKKCFKP